MRSLRPISEVSMANGGRAQVVLQIKNSMYRMPFTQKVETSSRLALLQMYQPDLKGQ